MLSLKSSRPFIIITIITFIIIAIIISNSFPYYLSFLVGRLPSVQLFFPLLLYTYTTPIPTPSREY
jgi:hypothetical protein